MDTIEVIDVAEEDAEKICRVSEVKEDEEDDADMEMSVAAEAAVVDCGAASSVAARLATDDVAATVDADSW